MLHQDDCTCVSNTEIGGEDWSSTSSDDVDTQCYSCVPFDEMVQELMREEGPYLSGIDKQRNRNGTLTITADTKMTQLLESIPLDAILSLMVEDAVFMEEQLYQQHGFVVLHKMCDSLQGSLWKARHHMTLSNGYQTTQFVSIKRVPKKLHRQRITQLDGSSFCVAEDIEREATLLRKWSLQSLSNPVQEFMVRYVDYFESEEYLYLVTEYIPGLSLREFIRQSHDYMDAGVLSRDRYIEVIKLLLWQLCTVLHWLHNTQHCAHLDICLENLMVRCSSDIFITNSHTDGSVHISDSVSIVLVDFGVATEFDDCIGPYCCTQNLTVDNEIWQSPQVQSGDLFDAPSADMWAVGQILYQAITGYRLYTVSDILLSDSQPTGYWAVINGKLKHYLTRHSLIHHFSTDCWRLLDGLLTVSEKGRWSASKAVNCRWFRPYNYCYDVRVLDLFSLGTVLYHIMSNQPLYSVRDFKELKTMSPHTSHSESTSSRNEKLKVYLMRSNAIYRMKWGTFKLIQMVMTRFLQRRAFTLIKSERK